MMDIIDAVKAQFAPYLAGARLVHVENPADISPLEMQAGQYYFTFNAIAAEAENGYRVKLSIFAPYNDFFKENAFDTAFALKIPNREAQFDRVTVGRTVFMAQDIEVHIAVPPQLDAPLRQIQTNIGHVPKEL
jgi:hypothetical protein